MLRGDAAEGGTIAGRLTRLLRRFAPQREPGAVAQSPNDDAWGMWEASAPGEADTIAATDGGTARLLWSATLRTFSSEASLGCAGVAFFGFLSLFPAIAAAVIVFGLLLDEAMVGDLLALAAPLIPDSAEAILGERLDYLAAQPRQGLGIGLALTLGFAFWAGSRGVNALTYALTRAYRSDAERGFLAGLAVSIILTAGGFAVMALALVGVAILPAAANLLAIPLLDDTVLLGLRWPLLGAVVLAAVMALYHIAPYRPGNRVERLLPGALVASLLWLAASWLFSYYVANFGSYDATFGSLAAVVVLLLWFYYSAQIFLLGAMFNSELEQIAMTRRARGPATSYQ